MKESVNYKSIIAVALPVALQSLIQTSLGVIDQMMVSRLGGTVIAAAGLATHPFTILLFLLLGVSGGTGIFVAQYFGNGQYNRISDAVKVSYQYGLLITLPIMFFAGLAPGFILQFFTNDPEVIAAGTEYLKIISLTFLPLMVILIKSSALKACKNVKLPFVAGAVAVIVNTGLNYVFIYGRVPLSAGD
ncbi:MATE family efflux transporter [Fusibacter sp. JL216-2]|uniref:MATE family efflux transporter n=1 Tax=Fusibacter sp. JL216-2 TaxID=3071453 RepID=UPI003D34B723